MSAIRLRFVCYMSAICLLVTYGRMAELLLGGSPLEVIGLNNIIFKEAIKFALVFYPDHKKWSKILNKEEEDDEEEENEDVKANIQRCDVKILLMDYPLYAKGIKFISSKQAIDVALIFFQKPDEWRDLVSEIVSEWDV